MYVKKWSNLCFAFALVFILSEAKVSAQWSQLKGFPVQEVTDLEVLGDWLYLSSLDSVYRMSSGTSNISSIGSVGAGIDIKTIATTGARFLAGTFSHGLFESNDSGATWTARINGLDNGATTTVTSIAFRGDSIYAGTDGYGVFVSSAQGVPSWSPFRDGLGWRVAWDVYSIEEWNGILFTAAGQNGYVFRNFSDATIWEELQFSQDISTGLAMLDLGNLSTGGIAGVAFDGVYTSIDGGLTWSHHPAPFSSGDYGSMIQTPLGTMAMIGHLLLGTYIWHWTGNSWELFSHQSNMLATDIAYFDGHLIASTWMGLWVYPLDPTGAEPDPPGLPERFTLSQNYPNPFNPETEISFSLSRATHVRLMIHDVLGRTVRTLINENLSAGQKSVKWDGRNDKSEPVSSGVYLYRLQTATGSQTRKMILLK